MKKGVIAVISTLLGAHLEPLLRVLALQKRREKKRNSRENAR